MSVPVHIVVALPSEAKPLVRHFSLNASAGNPFKIYASDAMRLIVSGVGKGRSNQAVHSLHEHSGRVRNSVWLNVGLCGHSDFEIGTPVLAHKITDQASGGSWYPPLILNPLCETADILTVDRPETEYGRGGCVYEMEASGFYEVATQFSTSELIHCFKVVSDNRRTGLKLSAERAEQLIAGQLGTIQKLVENLSALARKLPEASKPEREFERITARWHFTVTEQHRLRRLLARLKTLEPEGEIPEGELENAQAAGDVLRALEQIIYRVPVKL